MDASLVHAAAAMRGIAQAVPEAFNAKLKLFLADLARIFPDRREFATFAGVVDGLAASTPAFAIGLLAAPLRPHVHLLAASDPALFDALGSNVIPGVDLGELWRRDIDGADRQGVWTALRDLWFMVLQYDLCTPDKLIETISTVVPIVQQTFQDFDPASATPDSLGDRVHSLLARVPGLPPIDVQVVRTATGELLDAVRSGTVPPDLRRVLAAHGMADLDLDGLVRLARALLGGSVPPEHALAAFMAGGGGGDGGASARRASRKPGGGGGSSKRKKTGGKR